MDAKYQYHNALQQLLSADFHSVTSVTIWIDVIKNNVERGKKAAKALLIQNDEHLDALIDLMTTKKEYLDLPKGFLQLSPAEDVNLFPKAHWESIHIVAFYSPQWLSVIAEKSKNNEPLREKLKTANTKFSAEQFKLYYADFISLFNEFNKKVLSAIDHSSNDHYVAHMLKTYRYHGWNLLHILARYRPYQLKPLFVLGIQSELISDLLTDLIVMQNEAGWTPVHMMVCYAQNVMPLFFEWAQNDNIDKPVLQSLILPNRSGEIPAQWFPRYASEAWAVRFKEAVLNNPLANETFWYSLQFSVSEANGLQDFWNFLMSPDLNEDDFTALCRFKHPDNRTLLHQVALYAPRYMAGLFEKAYNSIGLRYVLKETLTPDDKGFLYVHYFAACNIESVYQSYFSLGAVDEYFQQSIVEAQIAQHPTAFSPLRVMAIIAVEQLQPFFAHVRQNSTHRELLLPHIDFNGIDDWPVLHLHAYYLPKFLEKDIRDRDVFPDFYSALSKTTLFGMSALKIMAHHAEWQLRELLEIAKKESLAMKAIEAFPLSQSIALQAPKLLCPYLKLVDISPVLLNDLVRKLLYREDEKSYTLMHPIIHQGFKETQILFHIAKKHDALKNKMAICLPVLNAEGSTVLFALVKYAFCIESLVEWTCHDNDIQRKVITALPLRNSAGKCALEEWAEQPFYAKAFDLLGRVKTDSVDPALVSALTELAVKIKPRLAEYLVSNVTDIELSVKIEDSTLLGTLMTAAHISKTTDSVMQGWYAYFFCTPQSRSINHYEYWLKKLKSNPRAWLTEYQLSPEPTALIQQLSAQDKEKGHTVMLMMTCITPAELCEVFVSAKSNAYLQKFVIATACIANTSAVTALKSMQWYSKNCLFAFFELLSVSRTNDMYPTVKEKLVEHDRLIAESIIDYCKHHQFTRQIARVFDPKFLLGDLIDQIQYKYKPLRVTIDQLAQAQQQIIAAFHQAPDQKQFLREAIDCFETIPVLFLFARDDEKIADAVDCRIVRSA